MRQKLIAGNWKSNGDSRFVEQLIRALVEQQEQISEAVSVAVCPPTVYLRQAKELLKGSVFLLGAQNVSAHEEGAYTGEVTAAMLKDVGCELAIVGHSERRTLFAESDDQIAAKVQRVLEAGLSPVLCVGETLDQRRQGVEREVCRVQLETAVAAASRGKAGSFVVAYEPVWAIGTGETATPEQVQEMHGHLREVLRGHLADEADQVRILYGGSVKAANAQELFSLPDVDGGLIGGASLVADEFLAVCKAGVNA